MYRVKAVISLSEQEIDLLIRMATDSSIPEYRALLQEDEVLYNLKVFSITPIRPGGGFGITGQELNTLIELLGNTHEDLGLKLHDEFQELLDKLRREEDRVNGIYSGQ